MSNRSGILATAALLLAAGPVSGQETGMPMFWAPYRAFDRHELGAAISFPDPGTAFEGFYGFGSGRLDIGLRGGFFSPGSEADTQILVGVHARHRVITHSDDFPVDGAAVLGVGAQLVEDNSGLLLPGGLTLGRSFQLEDSEVSIVPYIQPTVFLAFNDGTEVLFAFGLGADFRLSRVLDARISVGLGDVNGVSIGAVWVR
ncbi:MAG: hypothetical protein JSW71_13515 [Gemmatimonadota bacterium]|nr:MAG: hypothetical protein JSW71_13515 [Gemmatimonadota bacterium]